MLNLEKALILRQFSFLKNFEKQKLAEDLTEGELYDLEEGVLQEVLGRSFSQKRKFKKIYPKIIHTQAHLLHLQNVQTCFWGTETYPSLLKEIYDPPFVLFYKGSLPPSHAFAVVGSRTAMGKAVQETQKLGAVLGKSLIPVISGLAHGIDTAIHQGVINGKGRAFAVLATSVDDIYPKNNRSLAGSILYNGGGLISETAPQETVGRYSFAKRNRIISGLSVGTLVMQAALKSGALITAQCALDQGREVFMWNDPEAGEGVHSFLDQGATPYRGISDLVPLLGESLLQEVLIPEPKHKAEPVVLPEPSLEIKKKLTIEENLISDLMKELGI